MNNEPTAAAVRRAKETEPENPVAPAMLYGDPGLQSEADATADREQWVARMRLLWENRRLLRRAAVVGLLASALLAFLIPVRYRATTQLMPPESPMGSSMGMLAALSSRGGAALGGMAGDLLGVKNSGALFVGVLQSRTVADRLIAQFQLSRVYRTSKIEDTRKELAERTSIAEDRKSGIQTITVTDHDPLRAAAMAQAYVTELDRLVAEVGTSSARRERIFLEERLRSVKSDLDLAAKQFSEFASKNTAIDIPAQGKAMVEAAALLQGQLIAAESELRGIEQIYTANNVRVRSLQARAGELRQQLQNLGVGETAPNGTEKASLYPSIRKLPLLGVTYADLYRRTKIQETIFELLTQQYELAKVQEAKEIPSVKVLDLAMVPTKKSYPSRPLVIVSGTFLAVLLAISWVVFSKRWNETDPNDPSRILVEEMAASMRASARHFTPVAATLRNAWEAARRKVRSKPKANAVLPQAAVQKITGLSPGAEL
jgi:capsule polysaccharide export protein KpsE/RkpR